MDGAEVRDFEYHYDDERGRLPQTLYAVRAKDVTSVDPDTGRPLDVIRLVTYTEKPRAVRAAQRATDLGAATAEVFLVKLKRDMWTEVDVPKKRTKGDAGDE